MTANSSKLQTIQALRGIAAAMIVILHGFHEVGYAKPEFPLRIGVDIFFVISGFIMVYTSRKWFGEKGAWKTFITRRLIRIVPVYWFYTSALVVVALVMPHALETVKFEPLHVFLSYLFIPHKNPTGGLHPFLDLGWTLNYEMYFYVVFAALLFLPIRRMLLSLTVFFLMAVVAGFFIPEHYGAAYFWTRPIILEFVGGAWVGYAYLSGKRLSASAAILLPVLAAGLVFIPLYPADLQPWITQVFAILFVALAVLPQKMDDFPVPRAFSDMGDASYTLYLSHPFILAALALVGRDIMPPSILLALGVLMALSAGYILYLLIEKPLLSAAKKVILTS